MDVQKSFDTVQHASFLDKLLAGLYRQRRSYNYTSSLPTIADLYTNMPGKLPQKKTVKQMIYKLATEEIEFLNPSMSANIPHD